MLGRFLFCFFDVDVDGVVDDVVDVVDVGVDRVPPFIQMLPNCSQDAPTERAKRAEYVRITYLLRTDYLFIT